MSLNGVPLGELEGERLEFKSREVLEQPEKVAREVVGMLNAEGGEVWVGLAEVEGRAGEITPIEQPEHERDRLQNHLVDTIEPCPSSREVEVEIVQAGPYAVLRLIVRPEAAHRPYAQLKRSGRYFLRRVGARNVPMARHELERAFRRAGGDNVGRQAALDRLQRRREKLQTLNASCLWICLEPTELFDVDLAADDVRALLTDPQATGNRPGGWNFVQAARPPEFNRDGLRTVREDQVEAVVGESGWIALRVPLTALDHGGARTLEPLALLEHTTAALRLAASLYAQSATPRDARILADLALLGVAGWRLAVEPLPEGANGFRGFEEAGSLIWEQPREFAVSRVVAAPDHCAYELYRRVFRAFGYDDDQIPQAFDRGTGRLVLPG